jgi:hypothetical protein
MPRNALRKNKYYVKSQCLIELTPFLTGQGPCPGPVDPVSLSAFTAESPQKEGKYCPTRNKTFQRTSLIFMNGIELVFQQFTLRLELFLLKCGKIKLFEQGAHAKKSNQSCVAAREKAGLTHCWIRRASGGHLRWQGRPRGAFARVA